jgi:arsenate reductase
MMLNHPRLLFVCKGNSVRSILAEGLMRQAAGDLFDVRSAGATPNGKRSEPAHETLAGLGASTEGLHSKSWHDFAETSGAPADIVITLCDAVAAMTPPDWKASALTAHWSVTDPGDLPLPPDQKPEAYRQTAMTIKRRIDAMLALPLASMQDDELQAALREIGGQ